MTGPILRATNLGKRYTVRPERSILLGFTKKNRPRDVWALRGLDLEVQPGEIVAAIGRNGAGKSTLLKLAAGVSHPNEGTLVRPRHVAPLIEVGAGFHPELTGRENVGLNARLLGLTQKALARRFDEIVDFSELHESIDQPVKQYSSGMFMRLGFSIAVHTDPELVVVDEVLAVGDLPFQVRCMDRLRAMKAEGVGILFVSHNLAAVLGVADRALLLERGRVQTEGDPADVVGAYHRLLAEHVEQSDEPATDDAVLGEDSAGGELKVIGVEVRDDAGDEPLIWEPGSLVHFTITFEARRPSEPGKLTLGLKREGTGVVAQWYAGEHAHIPALRPGQRATVRATFRLNVGEGGYLLDGSVASLDWARGLAYFYACYRFGVRDQPESSGVVHVSPTFECEVTSGDPA